MHRCLDARAERAAGREAARTGWRVVVAKRTPPLRATADRRYRLPIEDKRGRLERCWGEEPRRGTVSHSGVGALLLRALRRRLRSAYFYEIRYYS